MTRSTVGRVAAMLAWTLLLGCSADDGTGPDGGSLAGQVRCSFYYRASNEFSGGTPQGNEVDFEERTLDVAPNGDDSATLGALTLSVGYDDDEFEGAAVYVGVEAGDTRLFRSLYQLRHRELPENQFVGGHGFTGLIYLTHPSEGGDYQLICESVT